MMSFDIVFYILPFLPFQRPVLPYILLNIEIYGILYLKLVLFRKLRVISMIDRISAKIVETLIENKVIPNEDQDVYLYGLQLLISTTAKGLGLMIIAILLGFVKETFVFIITFMLLRINAGGYHSHSYLRCFAATVCFVAASIAIVETIGNYNSIYILLAILGMANLLVFLYAPADTPNKPLIGYEIKMYRKRSIVVVGIGSLIILGVYSLNNMLLPYCSVAALGFLIESITLMPIVARGNINFKKSEGGVK